MEGVDVAIVIAVFIARLKPDRTSARQSECWRVSVLLYFLVCAFIAQWTAWSHSVSLNSAAVSQTIVLDALVKHHTYDGLGRLVRTQSPYPSPELFDGGVRTERFFHDGVRRLQEVVSDPVISMAMAMGSGDPDLLSLATAAGGAAVTAGEVDGSATPQARGTKFRAGDWTA